MHYENIIKRFLFRKNVLRRIKGRLKTEWRKIEKKEFSDIKFIYKLINKEPEIILDCGANIGFVSFQFRKKFPHSVIHAFEPNPDVFRQASNTMSSNNVQYHNVGVGSSEGEIVFYKNKNTGTSSFLTPNDFHSKHMARKYEQLNVPVIRLSQFLSEHELANVSILKLDIEGFELEVLKDLHENLNKGQIDMVFCEVNYTPTYHGQPLLEDIIVEMRQHGFVLYNSYGLLETQYRQALITNLLFLSPVMVAEINKQHGKLSIAQ